MLKRSELIRSEKHALRASKETHADLVRTTLEYRKLVRALAGIIFVHLHELRNAPSKCAAVERLFHTTTDNPSPRYALVDRMFHKFPSYLRRAAIESAFGAVSSFVSNYARWASGQRTSRNARPPAFARMLDVNPPLYGGQCIRIEEDFKTVSIKVLRLDDTWGWTEPIKLQGTLKRMQYVGAYEAQSPTLLVNERKASLSVPVKFTRPRIESGDLVCAVDLGINTGATCAIVDSAGTVRASKFLTCGSHNDRLDKLAGQIRHKAELTLGPARFDSKLKKLERPGKLSKGFCQELYARVKGLNNDSAQQLVNAILAFAASHNCQSLVFEHLKHFRPKAGRAPMRQRFHRWLHRLVVKKATHLAQELGLRLAFVNPRGTSAWAHDGSGEVTRDTKNYSLCTFATGKRYNADRNAALNIAARFIAKMLGVTTGDRTADGTGKSSGSSSRMPIVLADIWRHAGAPV